ncbi:Hypothetical protein A7982_01604 [Minicystis rosea]|nr:Hypothetical protein A7982_01604 [Minicystis rosea]
MSKHPTGFLGNTMSPNDDGHRTRRYVSIEDGVCLSARLLRIDPRHTPS